MSEGGNDQGEKSHDPTPKKLEDARKKGDIAKSLDISATAAYGGLTLALLASGSFMVSGFAQGLSVFLAAPDRFHRSLPGPGGDALAWPVLAEAIKSLAPVFVLPFVAVLVSLLAQRAFVWTPDKLAPKLSRLSLIKNAGQKFGPTGLVQFFKNTLKMLAYAVALVLVLRANSDEMIAVLSASASGVARMLGDISVQLLIVTTAIATVIGIGDLFWQRFDHQRKLRMSHQDLKDEHKSAEGDPHMKGQRRQRAHDIASNRMLQDVPDADVIVVNPTHFAVALKWSRKRQEAPVCVAKGQDEIAARIRELASEHKVPVHSDPPTARLLFSTVEIGEEIHPEHYAAVAAAIRFADRMRAIARAGI